MDASTGTFVIMFIAVAVTVDGWTEDLNGLGEEVGMEAGGFNLILKGCGVVSFTAIVVILHHLHDIVVVLGVAVEEGNVIATISCGVWETGVSFKSEEEEVIVLEMVICFTIILECFPCLGKCVIVG